MKTKKQAAEIVSILEGIYPEAECSLEYGKDYELLISTRLAAQCTDARVNMVTPTLFSTYPTIEALAAAEISDIEDIIKTCGLYKTKAKDIKNLSVMICEKFGGKVPDTMEELLTLPGIGRKTANLVLSDVFGKPAVVTDTHCIRLAGRMGLTDGTKDPYKVEMQLIKLLDPKKSANFCHRLVFHGRAVCKARKPECEKCPIAPLCDYAKAEAKKAQKGKMDSANKTPSENKKKALKADKKVQSDKRE